MFSYEAARLSPLPELPTQDPCFPGQDGFARMQERSPSGSIVDQSEGLEDVGDCSHTGPTG
ncbi:hypothetical protein SLS62_002918 [Diatrype stigma]|uniref:Uncharacterized protein n=1 Tax=Diatrype stigma TaxID=117547 RepID=A0AAN9YQD2_9PEZI